MPLGEVGELAAFTGLSKETGDKTLLSCGIAQPCPPSVDFLPGPRAPTHPSNRSSGVTCSHPEKDKNYLLNKETQLLPGC